MKFSQQHIHDCFLADSGEYLENYQYLAHKWQTQGLSPAEHYAFAHLTPPHLSPLEDETRYLHHLCEAARGGYLHAWYKLAFIFEYGDYGVTPNLPLAERLLQLCFKKQHPNAIYIMACRLWQYDLAQAKQLLWQAAALRSQGAYFLLAECYARGRYGFRPNRRLATFYKKMAWRDDVWGV